MARHPLERALTGFRSDSLLVVVLGPTASGKTALSLALAERFPAEIVSCDSVAVYREFEIGTAKPSKSERLRAPHHLLDVVEPQDHFTAGDYARHARQVVNGIKERGNLPIVAGGSGLYLRAFLDGLFPGPQRSEELRQRLREVARERGTSYIHRILARLDAAAATKIHPNDLPKLIRAIEVCLASREKISEQWQKHGGEPLTGFRVLRIGLDPDRQALYERINLRAAKMFSAGLVEETRTLAEKYGSDMVTLSALGYKQSMQYLRGEIALGEAMQAAQQAHRNFAKRQMTWFRREPDVQWVNGFGDDIAIQRQIMIKVEAELPGKSNAGD